MTICIGRAGFPFISIAELCGMWSPPAELVLPDTLVSKWLAMRIYVRKEFSTPNTD